MKLALQAREITVVVPARAGTSVTAGKPLHLLNHIFSLPCLVDCRVGINSVGAYRVIAVIRRHEIRESVTSVT